MSDMTRDERDARLYLLLYKLSVKGVEHRFHRAHLTRISKDGVQGRGLCGVSEIRQYDGDGRLRHR